MIAVGACVFGEGLHVVRIAGIGVVQLAGERARAGAQAASAHRAGPRAKDGRVNAGAVVLQTAGLTSGVSGDKSPGDRARAAGPGTTPGPSTSGPFRHPVQTPS